MVTDGYVQLAHMSVREFLLRPSDSVHNAEGNLRRDAQESNTYLARKSLSQSPKSESQYATLTYLEKLLERFSIANPPHTSCLVWVHQHTVVISTVERSNELSLGF